MLGLSVSLSLRRALVILFLLDSRVTSNLLFGVVSTVTCSVVQCNTCIVVVLACVGHAVECI
jgi:hypothetical protein